MAKHPPAFPDNCATRRPPDSFGLTGPSRPLDPRTNAHRRDLAEIALAGRWFASHYARPQSYRCILPSAMIHGAPSASVTAVTQLLHGETFQLLDRSGRWAWGFCDHDHYVGYVASDALGLAPAPTHRVVVPQALAFTQAAIKAEVAARYAIGALLRGEEAGDFLRTDRGFIHRRHLAAIDARDADAAAVAERLVGLPYLWGGRGDGGIDCSGLVQVALAFSGIASPRDSDQQRAELGRELDDGETLRRGDLVFFPGHVGLMVDEARLVHANAWWMGVTIEPLANVVARVAGADARPVLARKRIEP